MSMTPLTHPPHKNGVRHWIGTLFLVISVAGGGWVVRDFVARKVEQDEQRAQENRDLILEVRAQGNADRREYQRVFREINYRLCRIERRSPHITAYESCERYPGLPPEDSIP